MVSDTEVATIVEEQERGREEQCTHTRRGKSKGLSLNALEARMAGLEEAVSGMPRVPEMMQRKSQMHPPSFEMPLNYGGDASMVIWAKISTPSAHGKSSRKSLRGNFVPLMQKKKHVAVFAGSNRRHEESQDGGYKAGMGSFRQLGALKSNNAPSISTKKGLMFMNALINGKAVRAMLDTKETHNFIFVDEAKKLGLKAISGGGIIKVVNSPAKPIASIAKAIPVCLGTWSGKLDFSIVPMDDFQVVLGMKFFDRVYAFPFPSGNSFSILDGSKTCMVPTERMAKMESKALSALQVKRGMKTDPSLMTTLRELNDGNDSLVLKNLIPTKIQAVIDEYKDVIPQELPDKLTSRREMDHQIELEPDSKPPAMALYRMAALELEELRRQLQNLLNSGYIQPSKAPYGALVEFLGHRIRDGKLMTDNAKVKAIQEWEAATRVPELRSFLGLVNYYWRFIQGYSAKAAPLTDLLKKNRAWHWSNKCQLTFKKLKKAISKEPVLVLPDHTKAFEVHIDALDFAIRGVLMQESHHIAFESRKANVMAEALSRKAELATMNASQPQRTLINRIKEGLQQDPLAKSTMKLANEGKTRHFWLDEGVLLTTEIPVYVRKWENLRKDIIKECHDSKWAGHLGMTRTLALLQNSYYWPQMWDDVDAYVRTCLVCQQDKVEQQRYGSIMVVVDRFSKYATFIPALKDCTVEEAAHLFLKHMGLVLGSNWGQLEVRDFQFRFSIRDCELKWKIAKKVEESDGLGGKSPAAHKLAREWHKQVNITRACLDKATRKMKKWADTRRRPLEFNEGDLVLIKLLPQQFKSLRQVHKGLVRKYESLFPIIKRVGKVSYQVRLPPRLKIHLVFHVSFLKPYHADMENPSRGESKRAPTVIVTAFDKDVECILADWVIRRRGFPNYTEYLVKWKDLPDSEAS
ncbi:hypothetical protein EZV62_012348 [Acer yangbiense]|uniref:Chromo domain-containing protein n=1 Tax=Acer yangbiense TaxID=1000413 RepID=A0A5C7HW16_9ROSI|nr:hypothetical protein EZV62_012348 [Acer yangbiense]